MKNQNNRIIYLYFLSTFVFLLSSCQPQPEQQTSSSKIEIFKPTTISSQATSTPFLPEPEPENFEFELEIQNEIQKYVNKNAIEELEVLIEGQEDPKCVLRVGEGDLIIGNLTFVLVEPFNSIRDDYSAEELEIFLFRDYQNSDGEPRIFLSESSINVLRSIYDDLSNRFVVVPDEDIFESVLNNPNSLAILPFEELNPRWKVLIVEGSSPIRRNYESAQYLLNFPISFDCQLNQESIFEKFRNFEWITNRNDNKMTVLLMSGTTALTRATAHRMEIMGVTYPGEEIKAWFDQSDFRHVSSETPFFDSCPFPNPVQSDLSFCSNPDYLELFSFLGINVIELTGNHLLDKGNFAFEETLRLFNQYNFPYFAGGYNLLEARTPLLLEHNGNKIAFLGCNLAGPSNAWASGVRSGVASCEFQNLENQINNLRQEGYLPIVTFQYFESNYMQPSTAQKNDFRRMVDAGAVIVSGSQSHVPMTMELHMDGFIHYGLGNLFFDQMDYEINRKEFLDRHIFYDGRYISTELLTAKLEDYAQPVPMTQMERENLLSDVFDFFEFNLEK